MDREKGLSVNLNQILNSFGIIYTYEDSQIPVKYGRLEQEGELNPKVVSRIYIQLIGPDGGTKNAVFGLITKPVTKAEMLELTLAGEFRCERGKRQIWINNGALPFVRVTVPSHMPVLTYKDPV